MPLRLPALPCLGVLCKRGVDYLVSDIEGFHITCLWCRMRRRAYCGYTDPKEMAVYIYLSQWRPPVFYGVRIDPRGNYYQVRLTAIRILDKIMLLTKRNKPFIQICEFLANYP